MKFILSIIISVLVLSITANDATQLNLHIVPHTHNDLGWLFSVASYYLGNNPRGCVECILNNVTQALYNDTSRRFSYVEMGYFRIWWGKQSADSKKKVRQLVDNGQLEFLNSGVVMSDEGAAYYDDIIEQMSKGLRFVKETFNYTVRTGWHIDPFGHSAAQANMFSQMGFNSWFFERIDYQDYTNRIANKNMETLWRPKSFSDFNYILAHVNYMSYYLAPLNWCIEITCYPSSSPFDSMQLMFKYATWVRNQSDIYLSNQILHQVGGDFEFHGNAARKFQSFQFIIDYFNAHPEFNIRPSFSTPGNYTNALYGDFIANKTKSLTTKVDDFMSYVDVPHAYWTGYYTSRANFKRQIRAFGQHAQTIRKIFAKALLEKSSKVSFKDIDPPLDQFEEIQGILQHHDAVSGTATQKVTQNYINMMACATKDVNEVLTAIVGNFTSDNQIEQNLLKECSLSKPTADSTVVYDMIQANFTSIKLTIYNPSVNTKKLVQVKIPRLELKVQNSNNTEVPADIMCDDYSQLLFCNLYFYADIPTNTFGTYKITLGDIFHSNIIPAVSLSGDKTFSVGSNFTFKVSANLLDFVVTQNKKDYPFKVYYNYYDSYYQQNEQASGIYIFRPAHNYSSTYSKVQSGRYFIGKNLIQIQVKGDKVITSLKLQLSSNYDVPVIQVDSLTLPVDISDGVGKEITINFKTSIIDNKNTFYTDANGLEMQKRVLNYRDTYKVNLSEPIAGNYYPIYSAIYIEDSTSQRMTVVNDRSQGGSSLNKGEIELMIQRRTLHQDDRGMEEALNETDSNGVGIEIQTTHYLFFSQVNSSLTQRKIQYDIDSENLVFAATLGTNATTNKVTKSNLIQSISSYGLNPLVKYYIRPYSDVNFLVRLHNLNEQANANVDLIDSQGKPLILSYLIGDKYLNKALVSIEELTLSANQNKKEMQEKKFRWDGDFFPIPKENLDKITLAPLEMKVFNVTIKATSIIEEEDFFRLIAPQKCNCNCIFSVSKEIEWEEKDFDHHHLRSSKGEERPIFSVSQMEYIKQIQNHKKPESRRKIYNVDLGIPSNILDL